ncbi:hypothetical protein CC86DRAFT_414116 [Ophiobolus disseminans]|uniref:Uncharacterized protein n=1 Tax=Ophiobolus disseminans TaxID=1469910 RepID=A0A6A6ZB00_9PLEO|nr:hypothetical protein CC86DRAFT_414116 [Ophiobolus disseminans]
MSSQDTVEDPSFNKGPNIHVGSSDELYETAATGRRSTLQNNALSGLGCNGNPILGQRNDESVGSPHAVSEPSPGLPP